MQTILRQIGRCTFAVVLLVGCHSASTDQSAPGQMTAAERVIAASIEAHGGQELWESLSHITYTKKVTLYDSTGQVESSTTQYHEYNLKPQLSGTIAWSSGADSIQLVFEEGEAYRLLNGAMDSTVTPQASVNTFMASYHVLFQPFLLLGSGVDLSLLADEEMGAETKVHVIQPTYERTNGDTWWYYVDAQTMRLRGNLVHHIDHYSYVVNRSYDETTPIIFNHHRQSYRTDSLRYIDYLRAEYFYENFKLDFIDGTLSMGPDK